MSEPELTEEELEATGWSRISDVTFGDEQFRVSVQDSYRCEAQPRMSQLTITFAGEGWELVGLDETLGVITGRLIGFVASSTARHWGPFAGLASGEEVLARVLKYVFGKPGPQREFHSLEIGSALYSYVLSACFDRNLGTEVAVAIRGSKHETLIWQTKNGEIREASVPNAKFDRVLESFCE